MNRWQIQSILKETFTCFHRFWGILTVNQRRERFPLKFLVSTRGPCLLHNRQGNIFLGHHTTISIHIYQAFWIFLDSNSFRQSWSESLSGNWIPASSFGDKVFALFARNFNPEKYMSFGPKDLWLYSTRASVFSEAQCQQRQKALGFNRVCPSSTAWFVLIVSDQVTKSLRFRVISIWSQVNNESSCELLVSKKRTKGPNLQVTKWIKVVEEWQRQDKSDKYQISII